MQERECYLAFSLCPGIGHGRFGKLLNAFGTAKGAWESASFEDFEKVGIGEKVYHGFDAFRSSFDIKRTLSHLEKLDVCYVTRQDKAFSKKLLQAPDCPLVLYYCGNIDLLLQETAIAVVGSRKMTSYGRRVTEEIVQDLCEQDVVIVSGLALGVDAEAHKSAVENNGLTIAVLGNGVEECFPKENTWLYKKILSKKGLIVSEYSPGTRASIGTFPSRNRIIAGLCDGVLVVEAAEKSGSLLTAANAQQYKRTVFAVPGAVGSVMSRGTNKLIKEGGCMVESAGDILKFFDSCPATSKNNKAKAIKKMKFSVDEKKIVMQLVREAQDIDSLVRNTSLALGTVSTALTNLEMKECVKRQTDGKFELSL